MYWGNSLLWLWEDVNTGISGVIYWIKNLFPSLFYFIWQMIAYIVNTIETIFRDLAGLGSKGDMLSDIIDNDNVQKIFKNLVAFATAVIIFFTIIKIIQEHYKEKDGGNPYKILIRTFKGLLMFFFVSAAVTVGVYASQVMFKALDAATKNTSSNCFDIFPISNNYLSLFYLSII